MKRTLLIVLLNLMVISIALARISPAPALVGQEKKIEALEPGTLAPPFSLQSLGGDYVFLRDYTGQKLRKPWINKTKHVVVLSFFATWCVPCQKEIPQLMKIADMFRDQPVKFFLIDVGEKKSKVQPFIQKKGYSIPVLLDVYQVVSKKYGAHTLPRLVVIDKNGTVQYYHKGFENKPDFIPEMKKLIEGLLNK